MGGRLIGNAVMHNGDIVKFLLSSLIFPIILFGQGEFISHNHFALNINYAYSQNNNFYGNGGSIGVSFHGMGEFGLEFMKSKFDKQDSYLDIESFSTLVYFGYNIKRKNNTNNLKLVLGYMTNTLNGNYDTESSSLVFAIGFSIRAYETKDILLMPGLNFIYGFTSMEVEIQYPFYNSESYIQNTRNISLELNIVPKISEKIKFLLTPSISYNLLNSDNSLVFGIVGGVLFDVVLN